MIVREIKQEPEKVMATFDWFNDYKDTRSWLRYACPGILPEFDRRYKLWLETTKVRR